MSDPFTEPRGKDQMPYHQQVGESRIPAFELRHLALLRSLEELVRLQRLGSLP